MDTITYYFYYLSSHFYGYAPIIRVTVILIMLMGILYFISWLKIFRVAYKLRQQDDRRTKIEKRFKDPLKKILFSEDYLDGKQIEKDLGLDSNKMKNWEKAYITELIVKLVNENK
ncbi:hypothetical protein ACYSNV_11125 [Myroides sp. LJL119]